MILRPDLLLLDLDDDVVAFSAEAQRLVSLNASAALCVRKLQGGASGEDFAEWLVREGIAPPEDAAAWVTATLNALRHHGLLDGTDTGAAWADLLYVVSGAAVAGLVTWRVLGPEPAPAAP